MLTYVWNGMLTLLRYEVLNATGISKQSMIINADLETIEAKNVVTWRAINPNVLMSTSFQNVLNSNFQSQGIL